MNFAQPSFFEWCVYTFCTLSVNISWQEVRWHGKLRKCQTYFLRERKSYYAASWGCWKHPFGIPGVRHVFESCFIAIRGHSTTTWTKFYLILPTYPTWVDNCGHFTYYLLFVHFLQTTYPSTPSWPRSYSPCWSSLVFWNIHFGIHFKLG